MDMDEEATRSSGAERDMHLSEVPDLQDMTFEQAFLALEEVVERLEQGDMGLEEALRVYERGMALVRHCAEFLDQAELRVRTVQTAGGEPEGPFDPAHDAG